MDGLAREHSADEASINVAFDGQTVTLTGHVRSQAGQIAAEDIVRKTAGDCVIVNLIKIEPRVHAENIRRRIGDALRQAAEESAGALKIEVKGNSVTLEGKVHDARERQAIRHAAATTPGVSSVDDRLSVTS
ncbi:BON domain-containing protein [Starkeya sp. ORNL1]|nr:BON domain-containing protein [Starkeya sp. ORNL1]